MLNCRPTPLGRILLAVAIVIGAVGVDQATKAIAWRTLSEGPQYSYLFDTIRLRFALNPGGFLSLGNNLPDNARQGVFVGVNGGLLILLTGFLVWHWRCERGLFIAAVLILAGGVGNLIDRVTNDGLVTDFLNVGLGSLRTGIFNIADMAVLFGAITVFWYTWKPQPVNNV